MSDKSTDLFSGDGPTIGEIMDGKKKMSDAMGYFDALNNYVTEMSFVIKPLEEAREKCNLPPLTAEHVIAMGDRIHQLQLQHVIQSQLFVLVDEEQSPIDSKFMTQQVINEMYRIDRKHGYDKDATDIIEVGEGDD